MRRGVSTAGLGESLRWVHSCMHALTQVKHRHAQAGRKTIILKDIAEWLVDCAFAAGKVDANRYRPSRGPGFRAPRTVDTRTTTNFTVRVNSNVYRRL